MPPTGNAAYGLKVNLKKSGPACDLFLMAQRYVEGDALGRNLKARFLNAGLAQANPWVSRNAKWLRGDADPGFVKFIIVVFIVKNGDSIGPRFRRLYANGQLSSLSGKKFPDEAPPFFQEIFASDRRVEFHRDLARPGSHITYGDSDTINLVSAIIARLLGSEARGNTNRVRRGWRRSGP